MFYILDRYFVTIPKKIRRNCATFGDYEVPVLTYIRVSTLKIPENYLGNYLVKHPSTSEHTHLDVLAG